MNSRLDNERHCVRLPFGAELEAVDRTRFTLWAPAANAVTLEIQGQPALPMQPGENGVYSVVAGCGAGALYQYRIDGELSVPDPASRAQINDVHGHSVVTDPRAYVWRNRDWAGRPWHESVIYEAHPGCFGDPGGFAAIERRLPYLALLGVTALELMPIADFPGRWNWGYDGVLPYAPDSTYGSPEDLKRLIDTAHGFGIGVTLDVVYNHFGPDGNYLHRYAPQFFDEGRQSPWGASIAFARPQVREFFIANALYWLLEYRFDGLRLDAVHAIDDTGFLDELAARVRHSVEPGRHVHLVLENEHNDAERLRHGYDAQWNDDFHNTLHVLLTGEHEGYYANYAIEPAHKLARGLAEGFVYQGEPSPGHQGRARGTPSAHLPPTSFVAFLQNHDQVGNRAHGERLPRLADHAALRAATLLHLLCPQIPLLFMGEEWMAEEPFLFFTNFGDGLADAVREGRRKEFAGFTAYASEEARAAIPDPNAESTFRRSIPTTGSCSAAQGEHLRYCQELLRLRRQFIMPGLPGACSLEAQAISAAAVVAHWRLGNRSRLWIGINLAAAAQGIAATAPQAAGVPLAESKAGCAALALRGLLPAHSCCAYLETAA